MHETPRTIGHRLRHNDPRTEPGARHTRRVRQTVGLLLGLAATGQLAWGGAAFAAPEQPAASTVPAVSAGSDRMAVVAAMQPSWNLGNTLDAIPVETSWGNPLTTKATFDVVRKEGFRSVRIPVTWSNHQSATAPYTIDATYMARVKQVVDWAIQDGLYVDLNVHHDSWQWIADIPTRHDDVLDRFKATWTQIATAFRDEPRKLLFESVNEPSFNNATGDAQKTQLMNELNTSFHTVVRASGGRNPKRLLILPTQGCTGSQPLIDDLSAEMASLHDDNLVATVHYYGYWPFSVNVAGGTTYDSTSQKDMDAVFTAVHNSFVAKGIPVYMGEDGLLSYPDYTHPASVERGEALKYYEDLAHHARVAGVTTALWDPYSYLDRETLTWRDPALISWIRSSWTTRSGTGSTDQLYVPAGKPATAQTLTLNANGLRFRSLQVNGGKLRPGHDYTLSGDKLTLTAAALERLTKGHGYGTAATLKAVFSAGQPWNIRLNVSAPPVQSNATGTTDGLTVPTQFNGDELATMESTYADGSAAGGINWNTYQAFNTAFSPDYPNSAIILNPDLLTHITDGAPVTLTFHFWSGATLTYHITRSGTAVTGSVS